MKREILFRGKSEYAQHEWLYGSLVIFNGMWFILPFEGRGVSLPKYSVIPETVGQFTGMLDKNGVKIFDGDIVRSKEIGGYEVENAGIVEYDYETAKFCINVSKNYTHRDYYFVKGEQSINDGYCTIKYRVEYEVIGNIHDNKEL